MSTTPAICPRVLMLILSIVMPALTRPFTVPLASRTGATARTEAPRVPV